MATNKEKKKCYPIATNGAGAFYGLGFIGAVIYYVSTATSFWIGVLGFLKAIIWPVFFVYAMFKSLGL